MGDHDIEVSGIAGLGECLEKTVDPIKVFLLWLHKSKSSRLTLRPNTKGKNRSVWQQFRLACVDNIEQPYAVCMDCSTFVKYSGKTGTGGLRRHHCHRQVMDKSKHLNALPKEEEETRISPTLVRSEIEKLIQDNSERVDFHPNCRGKSDVWSQFDIITVDKKIVNFAACKFCRGIVTYVSRTGTGCMARHRCQSNKRAISRSSTPNVEESTMMVKQETEEDADRSLSPQNEIAYPELRIKAFSQLLQANLQSFSGKMETRASPPPLSPPPLIPTSTHREPPEDTIRRLYDGLLRRSLDMFHAMRDEAFFEIAQTLVNVGAEFGKIDIRQVLQNQPDLRSFYD